MDNIFYYSSMSSKDISLKTEQYLNGGNHEHTGASRNAIAFPQHSFEPIREDVPSTYSNAPTYLPPTPRISYEINEIPQENLLFKEVSVKVGDIINPANFYLVLQDKAIQYDALKVDLKRFYESNCFPLPIQLDRYYATKMEGTNEWNRVQVLSHVGKFCNCFFIDEGKTFYVPEERLFLLDDLFKALPPRSFKSGLLGKNICVLCISYF